MYKNKNYLELETIDKQTRCIYPFPAKFLVTHESIFCSNIEMTHITIWRLIPEIIKQSFIVLYWKTLKRLRRMGFLKTEEMCVYSLRDFTLKFWKRNRWLPIFIIEKRAWYRECLKNIKIKLRIK